MTAYTMFKSNRQWWPNSGIPGRGPASNTELKRWLNEGAIRVNGEFPKPDDQVTGPINDLVLFPKGKNTTTLM